MATEKGTRCPDCKQFMLVADGCKFSHFVDAAGKEHPALEKSDMPQ